MGLYVHHKILPRGFNYCCKISDAMGREHGQKRGKVISKDGDTNYGARCLMVSLLLLIACDITSCSFHSFGFILSSIQHRQRNCSICYEPDTKRLIMARLSVIWNFSCFKGLLTQPQHCTCYAHMLTAAVLHYTLLTWSHIPFLHILSLPFWPCFPALSPQEYTHAYTHKSTHD